MMEVWKTIAGYEDFYEVSNFGRVRSLDRTVSYYTPRGGWISKSVKGKVLKQQYSLKNKAGYLQVLLKKDGSEICARVHRLVAEAFLGPSPFEGAVVMHSDDNPSNNQHDNLSWGAAKDNVSDMVEKDRNVKGDSIKWAKLRSEDIPKIRGYHQSGMSCAKIAEQFNVQPGTIRFVVSGKTWKSVKGVEFP